MLCSPQRGEGALGTGWSKQAELPEEACNAPACISPCMATSPRNARFASVNTRWPSCSALCQSFLKDLFGKQTKFQAQPPAVWRCRGTTALASLQHASPAHTVYFLLHRYPPERSAALCTGSQRPHEIAGVMPEGQRVGTNSLPVISSAWEWLTKAMAYQNRDSWKIQAVGRQHNLLTVFGIHCTHYEYHQRET